MGGSIGYGYYRGGGNVVQQNIKTELESNDNVNVNNRGFEQSVDSMFFLTRLVEDVTIVEGVTNGINVSLSSGRTIQLIFTIEDGVINITRSATT